MVAVVRGCCWLSVDVVVVVVLVVVVVVAVIVVVYDRKPSGSK